MVSKTFSFREFKRTIEGFVGARDPKGLSLFLSELGENHDILTSKRFQAWFVAYIQYMDLPVISAFVAAGVDLNDHDGPVDGVFPLDRCIHACDFTRVLHLLQLGADPNLNASLFSVHYMSGKLTEDRIRMSGVLIDHGADVNRSLKNISGYTPILKAMDSGDQALVEYLKSRGAVVPNLPKVQCSLDLSTFKVRLEAAATACWNWVREQHPTESFCLFGFETDSECVILNGLIDSEQAIDRALATGNRSRRTEHSYVGNVSLDSDSEFYGIAEPFLGPLSDELNSVLCDESALRQHAKQKIQVLKYLEDVLANLDRKGLFGTTQAGRNRIVLLVSIIDADDREWKEMVRILRRLNPKSVVDQFVSSLN